MDPGRSLLLTDLYQLSMLQAYQAQGMERVAAFEFFFRELPPQRNFLLAAGLEPALDFIEAARFAPEELDWLEATGRFREDFLEVLGRWRFRGEVQALPEGSVVFPQEPLLRVVAPLPEAQLLESRLINLLHFQTLIASKAARCRLAAPDKLLVDFGMRRAHGAEAALLAARAAYVGGLDGTSTVLAGQRYGIPLYGTMAHSFIQAHDQETAAFEHFAVSQPDNVVLLIDTYDTKAGARRVVELAPRLRQRGIRIRAVRLDSGELAEDARWVRAILDGGGLDEVRIFCSGNLDEYALRELAADAAPIDGFGIGTRLVTSADAAYLDCAYKLVEYAGEPRRKRSEGKPSWPGRKQVFRRLDQRGRMLGDRLALEGEASAGRPLLETVIRQGRRLRAPEPLSTLRERAREQLGALPEALRRLDPAPAYAAELSAGLEALAAEADRLQLARDPDGTHVAP